MSGMEIGNVVENGLEHRRAFIMRASTPSVMAPSRKETVGFCGTFPARLQTTNRKRTKQMRHPKVFVKLGPCATRHETCPAPSRAGMHPDYKMIHRMSSFRRRRNWIFRSRPPPSVTSFELDVEAWVVDKLYSESQRVRSKLAAP